jgi:hypothetical protein
MRERFTERVMPAAPAATLARPLGRFILARKRFAPIELREG